MSADSRQADFCTYLSAILLSGLLLNALFGWWWADPVAALVMVPIIARRGPHRRRQIHLGLQPVFTFRAIGDMLLDLLDFGFGEFSQGVAFDYRD